jgi:hypothetical protein
MFQLASSYLYEISSGLIESVLVGKTQQPGMNQNKVDGYSSRKVFLIDIQQSEQPEQEQTPRQALVFIHSTTSGAIESIDLAKVVPAG